ncbi:MAG: hypothetical protein PHX18_00250 [Candidatus Gastranaerophilales bacterium]|nr:hypothetical protein [Candidatus Gastranaerophilales bacterium]
MNSHFIREKFLISGILTLFLMMIHTIGMIEGINNQAENAPSVISAFQG